MNYNTFYEVSENITSHLSNHNLLRYAIFAAESCLHVFETAYPEDKRLREAIEAAKRVLADDSEENRVVANKAVNAANCASRIASNNTNESFNDSAINASYAATQADPSLTLPILRYGIRLLQQENKLIENETLKQIAVDMAVDDMLSAAFTESI